MFKGVSAGSTSTKCMLIAFASVRTPVFFSSLVPRGESENRHILFLAMREAGCLREVHSGRQPAGLRSGTKEHMRMRKFIGTITAQLQKKSRQVQINCHTSVLIISVYTTRTNQKKTKRPKHSRLFLELSCSFFSFLLRVFGCACLGLPVFFSTLTLLAPTHEKHRSVSKQTCFVIFLSQLNFTDIEPTYV